MMSEDGDGSIDFTLLDGPHNCSEATTVLNPDGNAPVSSFPSFVPLEGSEMAASYGYAREGYEIQSLEQLRNGPDKEVYKERETHSNVHDGVVAGNAEYAENEILQSAPKTVSIVDIVAKNQPPQQQEPHDPSLRFTEPPPVPEIFPRDPVPQGGKGEGWPYAPQGWPNPDDKWGWRVGQRASASALWIDRYVTLPVSLTKGRKPSSDEQFASKSRLVEYLKQKFPLLKDPNSIFKAFDWKVPAPKNFEAPEKPEKRGSTVKRDKPSSMDGDGYWSKLKKQCRAGNPDCPLSKSKDNESESLRSLICQICCSEPGFCRECKCILCCKFFVPDADDYSIIRCLNSPLSEPGICGHAAHLECALNSQLAGVIKKNGLDLEYMCRRCDRKTYLKETVSRLVSAFMSKTVTESVERSLQLLLRVVQDPEDEARSSGKIQETLIGALTKVQEGADIVKSCKELTEQLLEILELQSGRSRAKRQKKIFEDSLHTYESSIHKRVLQYDSVGSPDAQAAFSNFELRGNNNSTPAINTRQDYSNDTPPAVRTINSLIVSKEGCEAVGGTTTSGTDVRPDHDMEKQLPSTSLQNPLKPEDTVLSIIPQAPSEFVSCTPLLSRLLDQSVCKPPTLSIEEHIRQCEAMANRVKGAGQINSSPCIFSVSLPDTCKVFLNTDSKSPNLTASCFTVGYHENLVVDSVAEASDYTGSPSVEELVASMPSSSRAKSPSLFNSQDGDEDHIASMKIIELRKSSRMRPMTRSSTRREKNPSLFTSQNAGGDATASTKIIDVSKSSRIKPPICSSGAKSPSLANSQDSDEDVVITQIIEVPKKIELLQIMELPTIPSFDPTLETTHVAGLEAEFEDQISEALEKLKRAQAAEYARAEEALNAQKKIVIEQYRQLEKVCSQFAKKEKVQLFPYLIKKGQRHKPRAELDRAMDCLIAQYGKALEGQKVFESMLAISNGFGQVSKEFLRDFFK